MRLFLLILAILALASRGLSDATPALADDCPPCGLSCFTDLLPDSLCGPLGDGDDTSVAACLCADGHLRAALETCARTRCSVVDALATRRAQARSCHERERYRRNEFFALFPIAVLAVFGVCIRLWSRYELGIAYEGDDYLTCALIPIWCAFTICGCIACFTAFGIDMYTIEDPRIIDRGMLLFFLCEVLYFVSLGLCKLLVLFFYLRIFPNKRFRLATYAVIAYITIYTVLAVFLLSFQCVPARYIWEEWRDDAGAGDFSCLDVNLMTMVLAANLIGQDLVILLLPLPLLLKLNTSWRNRFNIITMFSLGIFVVITSSVRLQYLLIMAKTKNPTYDYTDVIIWTCLEVDVSVVVACLPAVRHYLGSRLRLFRSTHERSGPVGGGGGDEADDWLDDHGSGGGSGGGGGSSSNNTTRRGKKSRRSTRSWHGGRLSFSALTTLGSSFLDHGGSGGGGGTTTAATDADAESQIELGEDLQGAAAPSLRVRSPTPDELVPGTTARGASVVFLDAEDGDGVLDYTKGSAMVSSRGPWGEDG